MGAAAPVLCVGLSAPCGDPLGHFGDLSETDTDVSAPIKGRPRAARRQLVEAIDLVMTSPRLEGRGFPMRRGPLGVVDASLVRSRGCGSRRSFLHV